MGNTLTKKKTTFIMEIKEYFLKICRAKRGRYRKTGARCWESGIPSVRRPFFAGGAYTATNTFYGVFVENKRPMFIGEIRIATANRQNIKLSGTSVATNNQSSLSRAISQPYGGRHYYHSSFNGKLFVDLSPFVMQTTNTAWDTITTSFTVTDYNVTGETAYADASLNGWQYKIIDMLGSTVYNYPATFSLDNTSRTISKSFSVNSRGDVNFDGQVTTADANLILSRAAGKTSFSYAQDFYGDYNADGKVHSADARLVMQASK